MIGLFNFTYISISFKVKLLTGSVCGLKFMNDICITVSVTCCKHQLVCCRMACRCFWDADSDNYAQDLYMNVSHTYTYKHTRTCTQACTHMHAHAHTRSPAFTHACACALTHTHMHTCTNHAHTPVSYTHLTLPTRR